MKKRKSVKGGVRKSSHRPVRKRRGASSKRISPQSEEENIFIALADQFPAIVLVYDAERRVVYLNALAAWYAKTFQNLSPEQVIGKRDEEVWPPEDTTGYLSALKRVYKTGEAQVIGWTTPERFGSREMVIKFVPLAREKDRVTRVLGVYYDTTETKEVHLSRQRMDFIIEAVGVGLWWNNWPLDKLNWNEQMKRHFHLSPQAKVDVPTFYKLIHPEDVESRRVAIERAVRDKSVYDYTFRTVAPDGSGKTKWVRSIGRAAYDSRGQPQTFSGITVDVTAQKEMETALRDSEARFRAMAEAVPDILYTCLPDGRCDFINNRFYTITGLPAGSAKDFGWMIAIHPEDAAQSKVDPLQPQWSSTLRLRCANGEYRWFISKAVPMFDARGRVQKWFGCATDIDDLFKMEKALEASQEKMRQLNRDLEQRVAERTATLQQTVADLEAFTYTIAHDLRAPLRAQRGYANLLIEEFGPELGEKGRSYAQSIATAAERLDLLVRDLLTHARLSRETVELAPLDLRSVLKDVLAGMTEEIEAKKAFITVHQPLLPVFANSRLLNQVITNLLSNALKFVKRGDSPKIRLKTEARDQSVRLWVEDKGLGIAPEYQEQIFGVFQRLHSMEEYPGTGIGLAIVKKATERMGGQVGVESQPGAGSRFWVELPAGSPGPG